MKSYAAPRTMGDLLKTFGTLLFILTAVGVVLLLLSEFTDSVDELEDIRDLSDTAVIVLAVAASVLGVILSFVLFAFGQLLQAVADSAQNTERTAVLLQRLGSRRSGR